MPVFSRQCIKAIAVLVLAVPALARANYVDDYVTGLASLDHGDYARAVQYLQKALEAQPNPVSQIRIDGNPQPYLPHHFLGMAHFKLGDCAAAGREWGSAMNLRMIGRLRPVRNQEEELLAQCKPGAVTAQQAPTAPPQPTQSPSTQSESAAPSSPATTPTQKPANTPANAGPPATLLRAYDDFVNGRYSSAVRVDPESVDGDGARFQAYLLRSAARFALSRLGDKNQLEAARRDARAAWALEKTTPDEDVFSPAFRAFYAQVH